MYRGLIVCKFASTIYIKQMYLDSLAGNVPWAKINVPWPNSELIKISTIFGLFSTSLIPVKQLLSKFAFSQRLHKTNVPWPNYPNLPFPQPLYKTNVPWPSYPNLPSPSLSIKQMLLCTMP